MKKNIKAKSHPSHYMMHKYWGRKSHNIVSNYIKYYTQEGDTVLDPFMGSGVVIIEGLKYRRQTIGVDINPMSCLIAKSTINKADLDLFESKFYKIFNKYYKKFIELYETKCPTCGNITYMENSIWEGETVKKIKGTCNICGKFKKQPDEYDLGVIKKSFECFLEYDAKGKIFYPKDEILKFVKRSGKTNINMLFSERALLILGSIILDIQKIKDKDVKDLITIVFTSMLPNVSKMIPGNIDTVNGRSGWVVSKLWAPKVYTEKNIFVNFEERFKKILKGKKEVNEFNINISNVKIKNGSSEKLNFIQDNSVDYIFTDPPYGDAIAYLGLSMFWNSWIGTKVLYDKEIIYDPSRNKRYEDFHNRIGKVYKEMYRVLKDKKYLSFTFHNRDLNIWKSVIDGAKNAGFHLVNIVYQEQAVSSGTQGLNKKNTLKGDFVYNFVKDTSIENNGVKKSKNGEGLVIKYVSKWIKDYNGILTSDKLYEKLIPILVEGNSYFDEKGNVINIEKILKNNFTYGEKNKNNKVIYGWKV